MNHKELHSLTWAQKALLKINILKIRKFIFLKKDYLFGCIRSYLQYASS